MRSRKSLLGKALNGCSSQRKPFGKAGFGNTSSLLPLRSYSAELQSTCALFKRLLLKWQQFLMITPWTMFPRTLTPAYLLNGQQIMSVPHPYPVSGHPHRVTKWVIPPTKQTKISWGRQNVTPYWFNTFGNVGVMSTSPPSKSSTKVQESTWYLWRLAM